ncbi:MAG: FHA domain-containing protein [Planctomycetes bacterium]|nr:FHA domain-containing protein [Planctomycetota bacterium]
MARLKVYDGQEKLADLELGAETVTIGRDAESSLVLPDASVSRRHAQVEPNGNFFLIRDNGSTNGTFVNEMLVRVQLLSHGDLVRIGKYLLRVEAKRTKEQDSTHVRVEPIRFPGAGPSGPGDQEAAAVRFERDRALAGASASRLLRLCEVQGELGHVDAVETLLDRALELAVGELQAERGSLLLCASPAGDCGGVRFVPAAVRGARGGRDGAGPPEELVIPEPLLVQATGRTEGLCCQLPGTPERCCLIAPLRDRARVSGAIYVERGPPAPPFGSEDLRFLTAMAGAAAIGLSNAQLFAEASAERDKVQAIFTSLTDAVLVTDRDLKVLEANAASTVLLGLQERNPLGRCLFEILDGFTVKPAIEVLRSSSLKDGALFHLLRASRDGKEPEALLAGKALPYPVGAAEPRGVVVILRDRSDFRRLEALKTQFIGNLAHKLRSPLTVVQGSLPLLKEGSGEAQQILADLERSSVALCRLVDEFAEFAELEVRSARLVPAPEPASLKALVREAVRSVAQEARDKGILLVERVREDLPPVLARAERLTRAFRRLLENAVKFTDHEGQVIVDAEDLGEYVRLDIVDDGPGIPREEIESVFFVCHQVDAERTGQVPGAGLGLTLARHLVQEHGGEIEITSPHLFPDRGTRVSVLLPARRERAAPAAGPEACAAGRGAP